MTLVLGEGSRGVSPGIESAISPDKAITIISASECAAGLVALQRDFANRFSYPQQISVIPILRSGERLGIELASPLGIGTNPMRMSYYENDTSRLPYPVCLMYPDISQIVTSDDRTKAVVFAECVVDSQGTLLAAMEIINGMIDVQSAQAGVQLTHPEYFTYAYVSKTGGNRVMVPNLIAAFRVNPDIWVGGLGCDLPGDQARELPYLVGILSPFATGMPQQPYYLPNIS